MAVSVGGGAPYAPFTAVAEFLDRNRNNSIPTPVTLSVLERIGISESLRPRTMQALKLLDYMDDDGDLTPEFLNLRKVATPEYGPKMAEMLRSTYATVFEVVDPQGATFGQVKDAFRGFNPNGQTDRMVSLFLALLDHTGMWTDLPSPRPKKLIRRTPAPTRSAPAKQLVRRSNVPELPVLPPPPPAVTGQGEVVVIDLGTAGQVTVDVNVRWFQLDDDTFLALRKAVNDLKSLSTANEIPAVTAGAMSSVEEDTL